MTGRFLWQNIGSKIIFKKNKMQKSSLLTKIKNIRSFKDLLNKIGNKINHYRRNGSFTINNWLVCLIYGKISSHKFFHVSEEDVEVIKNILGKSRELKQSTSKNNHSKNKLGNQMDKELCDLMNAEQTWFEIKKDPLIDNFIIKIKTTLRDHLKSPFQVVHVNAWKTRPNMIQYKDAEGNLRGPNRLHSDGYPPGHCKCIIYLQPLDSACGKIQFQEKIFESNKSGGALIFDNNLMHQSIAGNKNYRYCFELTLMRTVSEVNLLKHYAGTPDDKHLLQAYQAYF